MAKTKYTLLIPLNYNDGSKVPDAVLDKIYEELFVLGGGYANVGTAVGAYRMKDGSKQVDHSAIIWVGVHEEDVAELKRLASDIARRLNQKRSTWSERVGPLSLFHRRIREVKNESKSQRTSGSGPR